MEKSAINVAAMRLADRTGRASPCGKRWPCHNTAAPAGSFLPPNTGRPIPRSFQRKDFVQNRGFKFVDPPTPGKDLERLAGETGVGDHFCGNVN